MRYEVIPGRAGIETIWQIFITRDSPAQRNWRVGFWVDPGEGVALRGLRISSAFSIAYFVAGYKDEVILVIELASKNRKIC